MNSLFSEFFREFSGVILGGARLFGNYLGVIWEVFVKDFEGKTIQRVNAKTGKAVFFLLFEIAPHSLFIEGGVFIDGGVTRHC